MTKITIHGQKMQYHKRVAISVTLTAGTGGTATFAPATGTSYALNRLPIGTRIVKSTDTLYSLSDANGNSVGTITLVASSGYNVDEVSITRGGVKTTIGIVPIILQEGDSIAADFEATTMKMFLYNNGLGDFYDGDTGQPIPDGGYVDVPRADVLEFKPYGTDNGIIEIYKDGVWIPVVDYRYSGGQQAYIFAESSGVGQTQSKEFAPEPGNTYEFPRMWNLPNGYQYLDGSTFAFQNPPVACALVDYQTAGLESTDYLKEYFMDNVLSRPEFSSVQQVTAWNKPDGGLFNYVLYDTGIMAGMFYLDIMYMTLSGQYENTRIFVPFTYDGGHMNCYPYEDGSSSGLFVPRQNTNLNRPDTGLIGGIFGYGDANALSYWISMWQCSDECDFIMKISALANGYYQNL